MIGALLLFLLKNDIPALSEALNIATSTSEKLTVYAALGLTYCYIASTPLLVIHACRYNRKAIGKNAYFVVLLVLLITIVPILAVAGYFISFSYTYGLIIISPIILWFGQITLLWKLHSDGYEKLTTFYRKLDVGRSKVSSGLRDSYKHLREHGNSMTIVVLEINLAGVIYALAKFSPTESLWVLVGIFGVWIAPAAFVYVVGHELEYRLAIQPNE